MTNTNYTTSLRYLERRENVASKFQKNLQSVRELPVSWVYNKRVLFIFCGGEISGFIIESGRNRQQKYNAHSR